MLNYTSQFRKATTVCKCSVFIIVTQQNALHDLAAIYLVIHHLSRCCFSCRQLLGQESAEEKTHNLKSKQVASSSVMQANM